MKKLEELLEWGGKKKDIAFLIISAISLLISIFDLIPLPFNPAWAAIVLCGIPIILEAVIGLVTEFDIKADVLVSLALIAAIVIGEHFAAGEVAFIMQLGALLEDLTVEKARAGIEKLVQLTPRTARLLGAGCEQIIPAEQVAVGQLLRVLPGETIPVDGIIITGQTSVNQAVMTGESLPVDKSAGDEVSSGTVNQFGAFDMKAVKVGEDSSIQRMIRLIRSADAGKAKIVGLADRWATWIVIIALSAAALTWLATGEIIRSVTILVVFCPCALVLATPTAIMAAIGNATKHGFLVREGDALERLSQVDLIAFDKTGTLTLGTPQVTAIHSFHPALSEEQLYYHAAAAELCSEHPLGRAIVNSYRMLYHRELQADQFKMLPGRGVTALVEETEIIAGNRELLSEWEVVLPEEATGLINEYSGLGHTLIYLAADKVFAGFLALADTLRTESSALITRVKSAGITPVLLTGDHQNTADYISGKLEISEVLADCRPEDKLHWIDARQQSGSFVCMIGDGVNDAPSLKKAHVGIAMGGIGSDIAIDAADIALVNDDIKELPHLFFLARNMMKTIRCNLAFSMGLNFIAVILAMTGILNPVIGALVHNAGSIVVIINSALLLNRKEF